MLPTVCPCCGTGLKVESLKCENCRTVVSGLYDLPALARLERDEQQFVLQFVLCSGSLKEMARLLNLSYPTVRNRLDAIIGKLKHL